MTWLYRVLSDVNSDKENPGFKKVNIKPILNDSLPKVYYSLITPYGKLVSDINQDGNELRMNVTITVGSSAQVYIPFKNEKSVLKEGKSIINNNKENKDLGKKGEYYLVEIPKGEYAFRGFND